MPIVDCIKIKNSLTDPDDRALFEKNLKELTDAGLPVEEAYPQAAELTMEEVLNERNELAAEIRKEGGEVQSLTIEKLLTPVEAKGIPQSAINKIFKAIAASPDSFQFKTSRAKDLGRIIKAMTPESFKWHADRNMIVKPVFDEIMGETFMDDFLEIHNMDSNTPHVTIFPGKGQGGSRAYQIAMTWAKNNGKRLIPDRYITPVNRLRRTEAMLSSMLRHNTHEHLEPSEDQYVGLLSDDMYARLTDEMSEKGGMDMPRDIKERLIQIKHLAWDRNNYDKSLHNLLISNAILVERRLKEAQKNGLSRYDVTQQGTAGIGSTTLRRSDITRSLLSEVEDGRLEAFVWVGDQPPQALIDTVPVLDKRLQGLGLAGAVLRPEAQERYRKTLYKRQVAEKPVATPARIKSWLELPLYKMGKWINVEVVKSVNDIPGDHPEDVRGMFHEGKVWLVADNIQSQTEAQEVLAHEVIGHLGLETLLGKNGFNQLIKHVKQMKRNGNRNVRNVIKELKKHYTDPKTGEYVLDGNQEAREILAHLAEKHPRSTVIKEMWNRIKMWLSRHGLDFGKVDYDSELIQSLINRAAKHVQTEYTAFIEQPGEAVRRKAYSRLKVFHATDAQFDQFVNRDIGFHFAANELLAEKAAALTGKRDAKAKQYIIDDEGFVEIKGIDAGFTNDRFINALVDKDILNQNEADQILEQFDYLEDVSVDEYWDDQKLKNEQSKYVSDWLLRKGVKGIKYWNEYDAYGDAVRFIDVPGVREQLESEGVQPDWSYIVLDPNNIKVAEAGQPAYSIKRDLTVSDLGFYSGMEKAAIDMNLPAWKEVTTEYGVFRKPTRDINVETHVQNFETREQADTYVDEHGGKNMLTIRPVEAPKRASGQDVWIKIQKMPSYRKDEAEMLGLEEFLTAPMVIDDFTGMSELEKRRIVEGIRKDRKPATVTRRFTKDEVIEFIQKNGPEIEETIGDQPGMDEDEYFDARQVEWDNGTVWDDPEAWEHDIEYQKEELDMDDDFKRGIAEQYPETVMEYFREDLQEEISEADPEQDPDDIISEAEVSGFDAVMELVEEYGFDPIDAVESEIEEAIDEEASKRAEQIYYENPIYIYEAENTDSTLIIFGNDDIGYDIRTSLNYSDSIFDGHSEIWSLQEAQIQAQQYSDDNDLIEVEGGMAEEGERIRFESYLRIEGETYDNYREIRLILPYNPGYYGGGHWPDTNTFANWLVDDRDLSIGKEDITEYDSVELEVRDAEGIAEILIAGTDEVIRTLKPSEMGNQSVDDIRKRVENADVGQRINNYARQEDGTWQRDPYVATADKETTFFIEEGQSDWASAARKHGIKSGVDASQLKEEASDIMESIKNEAYDKLHEVGDRAEGYVSTPGVDYQGQPSFYTYMHPDLDEHYDVTPFSFTERLKELALNGFRNPYADREGLTADGMATRAKLDVVLDIAKEIEKTDQDWLYGLRDRLNEAEELSKQADAERYGVPDMPFLGDKWLSLAFKRALIIAAEEGYGAIGWSNSERLNNRWSQNYDYRPQYDEKMVSIAKSLMGVTPISMTMDGRQQDYIRVVPTQDNTYTRAQLDDIAKLNDFEWVDESRGTEMFDDGTPKRLGSLGLGTKGLMTARIVEGPEPKGRKKRKIKYKLSGSVDHMQGSGETTPYFKTSNLKDGYWIVEIPEKFREKVKEEGLPMYSRKHPATETTREQEMEESTLLKLNMAPKERRSFKRLLNRIKSFNFKESMDYFGQRINEGMFDGLAGLKYAEEALGSGIAAGDYERSGYVSARLATGVADMMTHLLHYGALQWKDGVPQGVEGTDGLLTILSDLGKDADSFLMWMAGNRAEELMAEGREHNLTADEIKHLKGKNYGKVQLFNDAKKRYNAINKAMLDFSQDAGLINPESRAEWESEWYIPFYRQMDENEVMAPHTKRGLSHQTSGIKRLVGGDMPTADLLENILANWIKLVDSSVKNMALTKSIDILKDSDYIKNESLKYQRAIIPKEQVIQYVRDSAENAGLIADYLGIPEEQAKQEDLINAIEAMDKEGLAELFALTAPTDPRVVRIKRNGKSEYWRVADGYDSLLRAITHMSNESKQWLKPFRVTKRLITTGITTSPDFMLKNLIRDAAHAWGINKDKFTFGVDTFKGLAEAGKEGSVYQALMAGGASFQGGYVHGTDPEAAAQTVRRELRRYGLTKRQIDSHMDSIIDTPAKMGDAALRTWEWYRNKGDKIENANRIATAMASERAGKSMAQVLYEAKDLMDYSMRGNAELLMMLTDMVPFLNARLQGTSKLFRAWKKDPKIVSRKIAMMALLSIGLAALNDDDERYQELPDWEKDTYWHFFIGDNHWRVPKPFEMGIIGGTMPERIFHNLRGNQTNDRLWWSFSHAILETLHVNPIPQLALPIMEIQRNRSYYFDKPIENLSEQGLNSRLVYGPHTSEIAKMMGDNAFAEWIDLSPKEIEHLWNGYTGTMGSYVLWATDQVVRQAKGTPSKPAIQLGDVPVFKTFYRGDKVRGTQYSTDFYDRLQEAEKIYKSVKELQDRGLKERAREMAREEKGKLKYRKPMKMAQRRLKSLRDQLEKVMRSNMSAEAKYLKQQDIQRKINKITQKMAEKTEEAF